MNTNRNTKDRARRTWNTMKRRCYNVNDKEYKMYGGTGVKISDEWLDFNNFFKWYQENHYDLEGEFTAIDKDILSKGCKIYSSETCLVVPYTINGMFVSKNNGKFTGLQYKNGKYEVKVRNTITRENEYHGRYKCVDIAEKVYKECKKIIIINVAEEYKNKIPKKVYEALMNYEV